METDYRNANYCAFYVSDDYDESNLGANTAAGLNALRVLQMWKAKDASFPFINAHDKTAQVEDGSDWEKTLKPRLRKRLRKSKNIILILNSETKQSKALYEEIDYGINELGLPVIVVYSEYNNAADLLNDSATGFNEKVKSLWAKLPIFKNSMKKVPTIHIPMNKDLLTEALNNKDFVVQSPCEDKGPYFYDDEENKNKK